MTDGFEEVRRVIGQRETISDSDETGEKIGIGSAQSGEGAADPFDDSREEGPDLEDDFDGGGNNPFDGILPPGFPVQPLGTVGGKFYFLTALGELQELSAGALSQRSNLVALMAGVKNPALALRDLAKPASKRDTEFHPATISDLLMQACAALPLFDRNMPIRHVGTWRGSTGYPIVHLGEDVRVNPEEKRQGKMVAGALYPSVPSIPAPSKEMITVLEVQFLADRLAESWNWQCENAGLIVMGWVGQAVLGQYPHWRTHLWVNGKNGSGKTTLLEVISSFLGGMSTGVKNGVTEASLRQTTNKKAMVRIIDEAEKDEGGSIEEVIKMFRKLSGDDGAQIEKGTSDHAGIRFELYGAGLLGSIIPGGMGPQDRSRFVMLPVGDRIAAADPLGAAMKLEFLEEDAKALGPAIWRRMLRLAPKRWDQAFRSYNALVQGMGGRSRDGDTIGTVLAGWDLMFFDEPLMDAGTGQPRPDRIERAKALAEPLLQETQEADEMGEGERLLNAIFGGILHKDHGGVRTVAEEIILLNRGESDPDPEAGSLLARMGLRVIGRGAGEKKLFVGNAESPGLNKALAGTRWRGGGHKAALQTIPDVEPLKGVLRVAGRPQRGLVVPARFLPGYEAKPENSDDFNQ